ncbi:MAG: PD40 domain-containing protein [Chloroflexi bacterium]|nr:PD40 domain-containing protein [Chloroflexota bacterium]
MSANRARPRRQKAGKGGTAAGKSAALSQSPRERRTGHAPRQLVAVTACALILALGILGWDLSEPWRNAPPSATGQIAMPMSGGVSLIDPANGRATELIAPRQNASVTAVAWSPDRQTLAYTLFHRRPEDRVSSAELFTISAKGGDPKLIVPRPQPGTVIDAPAWAPDGQSIYFAFQGVENGRPVARIERVELASGNRQQLFADASYPSISADGKLVAYMYDDGTGQSLRVGPATGGEGRELVKATAFKGLMGPRFSPDGSWIAFVAVGPGPAGLAPTPRGLLARLFDAPVAYAHGDPWNIWRVRPDGSDLQRATQLQEDEPLVAWSRDGAWLAIHGAGGLWIVDARGTSEPRRIADGTIGAIDW